MKLAHEAVAKITVSDWKKTCRNVAKNEDEYIKWDIVIDEHMESLIIDLMDSSDSEIDINLLTFGYIIFKRFDTYNSVINILESVDMSDM